MFLLHTVLHISEQYIEEDQNGFKMNITGRNSSVARSLERQADPRLTLKSGIFFCEDLFMKIFLRPSFLFS